MSGNGENGIGVTTMFSDKRVANLSRAAINKHGGRIREVECTFSICVSFRKVYGSAGYAGSE